ncbi:aminotransferase class III-fold pyridoxal phosphate-dependent enzyme [Herbaspirillum sp. LeCh32-8]|uniref:aminotransferase class III-fold pyridoxal phosphate-dependent enzyme n=1 Tax=Herbaspirillum sp. LeCh32-8 TaxID=2821356 RepID=UPI001AE5E3F5|nr:aminotransferase class III-fold pyridoxal phosphate-dependent enzyme [Herbaspirillum sp. LeCh32-8]MBP0597337.1 aminotransferase class III-fold pyridoxal phosphate-dependent enzyme [Herbaspirillum sp. LeCh32-8]
MNHIIGHALARPEASPSPPSACLRALSHAIGRTIAEDAGMYVWDRRAGRLLDAVSGLYGNTLGHAHAALAAAAHVQPGATADHMQAMLGAALSSHLPLPDAQVRITSSYGTARHAMRRVVQRYWKAAGQPSRRIIIGGHEVANDPRRQLKDSRCCIPAPDWFGHDGYLNEYEFGLAAARQLEHRIAELGAGNIAAFIATPLAGAAGLLFPPYSYWPEIERICIRHGVLLCVDESIGSCGRAGKWFSHAHFRFTPDIVLLAQSLTSGTVPLGALALSPHIAGTLRCAGEDPRGSANVEPTAAAIALANLDALDQGGLARHVEHDIGLYFQHCLRERFDNHPLVADIQGCGMVAALQLSPDGGRWARFDNEAAVGADCARRALAHGVLVQSAAARILLAPPLIATHEEIDELVERLGCAVNGTAIALAMR